ncbi:hypothetical protein DY000_02034567 [Brassica cretica]|uniref:Uncharacterized protein n=1 Tax=Brassica cretica TaxID=69181 RepID=A0ABQ7DNI3_BRACR|nr:hypothetical protein DY000_02034567 [Brassica cretica]
MFRSEGDVEAAAFVRAVAELRFGFIVCSLMGLGPELWFDGFDYEVGAGDEGRVVVVVAFERDDGKFVSVLANIASIVIGETGPFIKDWVTWNQVFLLVDIIRCCAIIFPLIWSIRSLFRQFYIVVIGLRGTKACTALAFVTLRADGEREFLFFRHPSADMLLTEAELDKNLIQKVRFCISFDLHVQ